MRYYSIYRPITFDNYPKPQDNTILEIRNYGKKTYCEEIEREAWGYVNYEQPLPPEQAMCYGLIAVGVGCTGCIHEQESRDMDCCWDCNRNPRRAKMDLYKHRPNLGGKP